MEQVRIGEWRLVSGPQGDRLERTRPREGALRPRLAAPVVHPAPFVGRGRELGLVRALLAPGRPVHVTGPAGIGVSTFLLATVSGRAARSNGKSALPHGPTVVLRAGHLTAAELLQTLADHCFATDPQDRASTPALARQLAGLEATVVLDDVDDPALVARFQELVPGARLLAGGNARRGERAESLVTLTGLGGADAVELFTADLGRPLEWAEREHALRLVRGVGGRPRRIRQAAALVHDDREALSVVADRLTIDPDSLLPWLVARLDAEQRRLLGVLAVFGTLVPTTFLEPLAGTVAVREGIAELDRLGLVEVNGPPGSAVVRAPDAPTLRALLGTDTGRVAQSLAGRLESAPPVALLDHADAVSVAYRAAESGEWTTTARLARAGAPVLLRAGRAEQAAALLGLGADAAVQLGDHVLASRFEHEQGTLLVATGRVADGVARLSDAARTRERTRDRAGLEVTRHNLALAEAGESRRRKPEIPDQEQRPREQPAPRRRRGRLFAATTGAVVALVLIGAGVFGTGWAQGLGRHDKPEEPIKLSTNASPHPVAVGTRPSIGLSVADVEFGEVPVGVRDQAGAPVGGTAQVTVSNTGGGTLRITAVDVVGRGFAATGTCTGAKLAAGGACTETVTFAPGSAGRRQARLEITPSGAKPVVVALHGTGTSVA